MLFHPSRSSMLHLVQPEKKITRKSKFLVSAAVSVPNACSVHYYIYAGRKFDQTIGAIYWFGRIKYFLRAFLSWLSLWLFTFLSLPLFGWWQRPTERAESHIFTFSLLFRCVFSMVWGGQNETDGWSWTILFICQIGGGDDRPFCWLWTNMETVGINKQKNFLLDFRCRCLWGEQQERGKEWR